MKINELLIEAQMNPKIKKILTQKGYKFLGHGQDQDAYLAPDGTILKIFGYEGNRRGLSKGQQSFVDFANFCMQNPNNPFCPQFGGWDQFDFEGQRYLQIKSERLFDFKKAKAGPIAEQLEELVEEVKANGAKRGFEKFLDDNYDYGFGAEQAVGSLITLVGGEKEVQLLCNTIEQLSKLAEQKGYRLDLHSGNFMLGSDGEIVINDPFWTGSFR